MNRVGSPLLVCVLLLGLIAAVGCETQTRNENTGPADEDFSPPGVFTSPTSAVIGPPLGSRENPVRCGSPSEQRAYLARLRGPAGQPLAFERAGSYGIGPHGNMLDGYEVTDPATGDTRLIFFDMYHPDHTEDQPVPGYTIVPSGPRTPR